MSEVDGKVVKLGPYREDRDLGEWRRRKRAADRAAAKRLRRERLEDQLAAGGSTEEQTRQVCDAIYGPDTHTADGRESGE